MTTSVTARTVRTSREPVSNLAFHVSFPIETLPPTFWSRFYAGMALNINESWFSCSLVSCDAAACANGHFFCPNPGFRGKTVSTMIVNDGVCDCCDGSDEWQSGKCGNRCEEEGRDWRQHMAERIKQVESGAAARKEYAAKGTEAVAAASSKASASQALVAEVGNSSELVTRLAMLFAACCCRAVVAPVIMCAARSWRRSSLQPRPRRPRSRRMRHPWPQQHRLRRTTRLHLPSVSMT